MDNPTKVLTIGIGALAAVAVYLGLKDSDETPEIIDSDIHAYDSKLEQEKILKQKRLEELEEVRLEEEKLKEEKLKEEVKLEELRLEEVRLKKDKEENVDEGNVKIEVKEHLKEKSDNWGTFWKSEYKNIKSAN